MTDKQRRVFVAWDSQLGDMRANLMEARRALEGEIDLVVLGAWDDPAHGPLGPRLREDIDDCDAFLAILQTPNGNAAWELGFAIARGLPVAVGIEGEQRPDWLKRPPFGGFLLEKGTASWERIVEIVRASGGWKPLPPAWPGDRTLLLTRPGGYGSAWLAGARRALDEPAHELPWQGFDLTDLRRHFWGAGRAAWFVPALEKGEERHGEGVAAAALLAGYADGLGLPVLVLRSKNAEAPADVEGQARPVDTGEALSRELGAWVAETASRLRAPPPDLVLVRYREGQREAHATLVPLLGDGGGHLMERIFVEPGITGACGVDRDPASLRGTGAPTTLRRLVEHSSLVEDSALDEEGTVVAAAMAPRWLLRGEPGSGKTTLLRHLAWELSGEPDGPLPVYLPLHRLLEPGATDPVPLFRAVEQVARPMLGAVPPGELERALEARVENGGLVWLLLDGRAPGACTTCTATSGSGAPIDTAATRPPRQPTPAAPPAACAVCSVVAAAGMTPASRALRSGTGTGPVAGTGSSAFASCCRFSRLRAAIGHRPLIIESVASAGSRGTG